MPCCCLFLCPTDPTGPALPCLRRDEVASCSECAYASLTLADAQALLMLGSQAEAEAYAKQVGRVGRLPALCLASMVWPRAGSGSLPAALQFTPTSAELPHLRPAAVRLGGGCGPHHLQARG